MIFKIARRNIFRHKGKALVIGSILFLGSFIMTLGNGIISGLNSGLQKHIVEGFTGDILLLSEKQNSESVLGGFSAQTLEPIPRYLELKPRLLSLPYIEKMLPVGIGYVWILNESGQPIDQYLIGVHFQAYQDFFNNNVSLIEGRLPSGEDRGVLVSAKMREWFYDFSGHWTIPKGTPLNAALLSKEALDNKDTFKLRDNMIFMGLSRRNTTVDIFCDVIGIFKFKALNSILGFASLVDIDSFRECLGYFTAESSQMSVSEGQAELLDAKDIESMLNPTIESVNERKVSILYPDTFSESVEKKKKIINSDWEEGTFNAVLVKLNPNVSLKKALERFSVYFRENHIPMKAVPWSKAVGLLGQMALLMKGALFLFVCFIFFVAVIIIMNTLNMAAMERVSEIGMMRAVGARKGFIGRMFLTETMLLSTAFGGLGIAAGAVTIYVLAALRISTQNEMLQIFFGGDVFHPMLGVWDILLCVVLLTGVTVLAVIYPLFVARKITPRDAMTKE